jgi:hypothetical protein
MKQTILTLKLYLGSLAVGLFIVGWALITRSDAAKQAAQTAAPALRRIVVMVQPSTTTASGGSPNQAAPGLAPIPDLPPIPALPAPIRTRTS